MAGGPVSHKDGMAPKTPTGGALPTRPAAKPVRPPRSAGHHTFSKQASHPAQIHKSVRPMNKGGRGVPARRDSHGDRGNECAESVLLPIGLAGSHRESSTSIMSMTTAVAHHTQDLIPELCRQFGRGCGWHMRFT